MKTIHKERIKEFGNPSAYRENRLYHLFAEHGQEDLYYRMVFYGLSGDELINVPLSEKYRALLSKVVKHQQKRIENISRFIGSMKVPGLWLDLGCGLGQFMNQVIKVEGNDVIGSDVSVNSLRKARSLLNHFGVRDIKLINQDPIKLPFRDNVFKYILSADVFEHVGYDKQKMIASEIHRILRKGGQAIIHTPNLSRVKLTTILKKGYYSFKGINPFIIKHSFPIGHNSLTTACKLTRICNSVGFKTRSYYQIGWTFYDRHKWISLGLDHLLSRSFILVLTKE